MELNPFISLFPVMPRAQQICVALFFAIAVIGGNYVFIRHNRRRGRTAWSGWNPFATMLRFDRSDWAWLAGVMALSFACFGLALALD